MLLEYYGLREQPFGVTPDPRFLFLSEKHQEAIAKLEFGIRCNRGFIVLIAPPGLGKTTLLYHMLEKFRTAGDTSTAFVFQTQCASIQLVRQLVSDLGIECETQDIVSMNQRLHQFLVQQADSGRKVVMFLDEAQNLTEEALETVRLLSNFETSSRKLLQIVLAGQPPLAAKLAKPSLHQLKQRVFAIARLKPLSTVEADAYVSHRLSVAGGNPRSIFTPQARSLLIESSKGIPREINALCFGALAVGYALRARSVDEAIARQSIMELTSNDLSAFDLIETSATIEEVAQPVTPKSMTTTSSEVPPAENVSHEPPRQTSPGPELNPGADKGLNREAVAQIFQSAHIDNRPEPAHAKSIGIVLGVLSALLLSISAIFYSAHLLSQEELTIPIKPTVNAETQSTPSASLQPSRDSRSEKGQSRTHSLRMTSPATISADENRGKTESSEPKGQQFPSSVVAPAFARVQESPASIITAMSTSNTPSSDRRKTTDINVGSALAPNNRALFADSSGDVRNEIAQAATPPTLGELIYSKTPNYPASARDGRVEGTVVLKAVVASNGTVVRAERVSGSPVLADAAIEAVRNWRYRPATSDGRPVEVETWIVLRFTLPKQ